MNTLITAPARYTPEDLLAMPDGDRYELVDGQLVEVQLSLLSSLVGAKIVSLLVTFCEANDLGWVWGSDLGFRCFPHAPGLLRKPDAAFIRRGRLSDEDLQQGQCRIHPDLAVEVVSPNDLFDEVDRKVAEYLQAGVEMVWVVSLATRLIYVHRPDGSILKVREQEELSGENVVPGLRCRVSEVFASLPRTQQASE
jgi:Uma2 family endonuclease